MLKAILDSLKNVKSGYGFDSDEIVNYFGAVIPNSEIYLLYSIKFELNRNKFKPYLKDIIKELDIFKNDQALLDEVLELSLKWYIFYLDNKKLFSSTTSLKSEIKKIYKKKVSDLKNFDRFFETILHAFIEAYNIYTVIFYNADAIEENKKFSADRKSCYINERPDYLTAIRQAKSYYVMTYKNNDPITRVWFVCDKDYENAVIFNSYGHKFKNLSKFFGDTGELMEGNYKTLNKVLGIYVNNDTILTTTDDYDCFIYKLSCPTCCSSVKSNELMLVHNDEADEYNLCCRNCNGLVYSDIEGRYIREDEAVYSNYHGSYIYEGMAIYSYYLHDCIYEEIAKKVFVFSFNDYDYVPAEMAVKSKKYGWVIAEEVVYSKFYDDYIPKRDAVFCKLIDSYIDENDKNFIKIGGEYIPTPRLELILS